MFSTTTMITRTAAERINAEGVFIFSASLSLAKSKAIKIANTPAADIAVAGRSVKKSPQQASVIIGVPIVNNVDMPLKVLYLPTSFISIPHYHFFFRFIFDLYNGLCFIYCVFYKLLLSFSLCLDLFSQCFKLFNQFLTLFSNCILSIR